MDSSNVRAVHVHKHLPQLACFCGKQNYSCLRCKHAACDKGSYNVKNSSVDERATRFTKTANWHDCDKAALLLWHMLTANNVPMLRWYAASKREYHMLECPGRSSSEDASPAAEPAVDTTRAVARAAPF